MKTLVTRATMAALLALLAAGAVMVPGPQQSLAQAQQDDQIRVAEQWWRIQLYELDHGQWRSAGTFENPDRDRCIRYGDGWKAGKPGYRDYTRPVAFNR